MGLKSNDPCLQKAKDDEPIFVLLGRDPKAASVVLNWIERSLYSQPNEKLREAFEQALKMKEYHCSELKKQFSRTEMARTEMPPLSFGDFAWGKVDVDPAYKSLEDDFAVFLKTNQSGKITNAGFFCNAFSSGADQHCGDVGNEQCETCKNMTK